MSERIDALGSARNVVGGVLGVLSYLCRVVWLMFLPRIAPHIPPRGRMARKPYILSILLVASDHPLRFA